jgi:acyl carrier protein
MSTLDELRRTIAKITRCNPKSVNPETQLKDIKADSLDWVQIIVGLESTFDIEVDIDRMQELGTIGDFVNYIDSCIS